MNRRDLRRLCPGPRQRIYLLHEGVFAAAGPGHLAEASRVGSLPSYVHAMIGREALGMALHPDVLGNAGALLRRMDEFCFCLSELVPQLRALCGAEPIREPGGLEEMVKRAHELESAIAGLLMPEPYAEPLAESLRVPCTLTARAVVPLEPVSRRRKSDFVVEVDGQLYRYRLDGTETIDDFLKNAERVLLSLLRDAVGAHPELGQRLKEFRGLARSVARRYAPRRRAHYSVFHEDDEHQLQYSRGAWMLVRGPLPMRIGEGTAFVALPIRGRTRRERLSRAPAAGRSAEDFWRSPGLPARAGICMGTSAQYQWLLSKQFTDAEAVVHWLDASAILATGRSEFHRRWRALESNPEARLEFERTPF